MGRKKIDQFLAKPKKSKLNFNEIIRGLKEGIEERK